MKNHLSKITILLAAITMLSLVGCNHYDGYQYGVGPSDEEVGCKDVHLCKGDTIAWTRTSPCSSEQLGTFFHYHQGDSIKTIFLWADTWYYPTIIEGHIVDYSYNDDYLLADQKPLDSIWGKYINIYRSDGSFGYSRREYDTINHYDKRRKQLEDTPTTHQYWIMVVKTADVYGPFSYEDYLIMKQQLGVPPTLKLKWEKKENTIK